MLSSPTINQHFLSRVEQKLNAIDAQSNKPKIYSFTITNRDNYVVEIENPKGKAISNNLSFLDIFSFDVPDGQRLRHNFEDLFNKYEFNIADHTRSLLRKLNEGNGEINVEIVDLFAAKLLNFVRNPYSVAKVINTFATLSSYEPTDPVLFAAYHRIVNGRKPHQAYLCKQLGISDDQYIRWLRLLFMLLVPMAEGRPNFFEEAVMGMLENPKMYIAAVVCEFDVASCLLSDRGFSQPIADGPHTAFSFNLCATAFVQYIFSDPFTLMEGKAAPALIEQAISFWARNPKKRINVTFIRNDFELLALYNRRVVEQSYKRVFCSIKDGIVL